MASTFTCWSTSPSLIDLSKTLIVYPCLPAKAMRPNKPSIYLRFPGLCSTTAMDLASWRRMHGVRGRAAPAAPGNPRIGVSSQASAPALCRLPSAARCLKNQGSTCVLKCLGAVSKHLWCAGRVGNTCSNFPQNSTTQLLTELSVPRKFPLWCSRTIALVAGLGGLSLYASFWAAAPETSKASEEPPSWRLLLGLLENRPF